jgi:hypothetical protein
VRRIVSGAGRSPYRHFLVGCALLALAACERSTRLELVTPRLDLDREVARSLDRLLADGPVAVDLVANPDPDRAGVELVKSEQADLALVPNTEPYDPALNTVMPLYPTVLHIAYRAELAAADVRGLIQGHSVFAGPPGSPSRQLLEATARRGTLGAGQINYVDQVCADIIVVYAPVTPAVPEGLAGCGDYRLFSLGRVEDIGAGSVLDSVNLLYPQLEPFVIPRETYGDLNPEPVVTLAVDRLLVARPDVPEAVVYDLIGEIVRLQPALSAAHPGLFQRLTGEFDSVGMSFALHPGAIAYLQRNEPDVYERYSGVAEVLVTLLIGLVSGTYAVVRIFSIRRKNRIDAFYTEALAIRDRAADLPAGDRQGAVDELEALKDRAYQALIHEKLAADESFRIFVTLVGDIIAELRRVDA